MSTVTKSSLAILWIGLVAGTLDISDNLVFNYFRGINPERVFRYIASGLIGPQIARNGSLPIVVGVALHYSIALFWTALFYIASRKVVVLTRKPFLSGLLYGAVVYVLMNFVVLPFSRVPPRPAVTVASRINAVLALLLFIGLTISLLVKQSAGRTPGVSI